MAECKKYFRLLKKGAWIYIWDNETRRNKKICTTRFIGQNKSHVKKMKMKIYFATIL